MYFLRLPLWCSLFSVFATGLVVIPLNQCPKTCSLCEPETRFCYTCKEGYTGYQCRRKKLLPVLLEAPVLEEITKNSVVIRVKNLIYGSNEAKPDKYVIQYKEKNGNQFKNSEENDYSEKLKNFTVQIKNISRKNCECKIRILLVRNGEYSTEDIPEAAVGYFEEPTITTESIWLTLSSTPPKFGSHVIQYKCRQEFCETDTDLEDVTLLKYDSFIIENLKPYTKCSINLVHLSRKKQKYLIDMIKTNTDKISEISDTVLPSEIKILNNTAIIVRFDNCHYFANSLRYRFEMRCISQWCYNNFTNSTVVRDHYKNQENIEFEPPLLPYTKYEIKVTAQLSDKIIFKMYPTQQTASAKPNRIRNFTIYCRNSTNLWLKWQPPYPPTGRISYVVNYNQKEHNIIDYSTEENFICTKITTNGNKISNITVRGKNEDNEELGIPLTIPIEEMAPAPTNLTVKFSPPNKVSLSWKHSFLKEFLINVQTTKYEENVLTIFDHCLEKFTKEIHLNDIYNSTIKISGLTVESKNASATVRTSLLKFSSRPLVQICLYKTKCTLSIPKPDNTAHTSNFSIVIKEKISGIPFWTLSNLSFTNDDYVDLEIGSQKAISLDDATYVMFLQDQNNHQYQLFVEETWRGAHMAIICLITLCIVALVLLSYLACAYKFKMCPFCLKSKTETTVKYSSSGKERESEGLIQFQNVSNSISFYSATSLRVGDLENYIITALEDTQGTNILTHQFKSLPESTGPTAIALQTKNKNKNRDHKNVPYDHFRVVLKEMDGMGTDDYINASYINDCGSPAAYIATQGPKFSTIKDFWRMIWLEKVDAIIMATNFVESKRRKCAEYFPQTINSTFECGQMSIKLINEEIYEHYVERIFKLCYMEESREVKHLQMKWNPDDCTPIYPDSFVSVVRRLSIFREKSNAPVVVHCSMGVNKTGTLILCDLALQMATVTNGVDVYNLTKSLREQRPNMVGNERQYMLAHLVVLEFLIEKENIFKKSLKENWDSTVLKSQLKCLERLCHHDKIVKSWTGHCNNLYESSMTNVLVGGYARDQKYMVTQQPKKDSSQIFWNMIVNEKILTVVFLNKTIDQVWPYNKQDANTIIMVKELRSFNNDYFKATKLSLTITQLPRKKIILERTIHFIQMNEVSGSSNFKNTTRLLHVVSDIHRNCQDQARILVACRDGITTCGLFVALCYIVEKYSQEVEIDVCNAVRTIRRSGAKFVKTKEQLEFLYRASLEYLENFNSYSHAL